MFIAIGLALVGLILVYFEFFVSGGILGIIGGLFLIVGFILSVWVQTAFIWSFIYIASVIILLVFTIRMALWKIKKTKDKGSFYLGQDQEGYVAAFYDKELVGKTGEAITALAPSGHIKIEGEPYQAVSESGYIKKGSRVQVVRGEGARLIVKEEII